MRNIFLFVMLLVSAIGAAQHKQMSLEDAIIGRYTYLNPESMEGLSWKDNETFSYVRSDTLWAEDVRSGERKTVVTLAELNELSGSSTGPALHSFAGYSWCEDGHLLMRHDQSFFIMNPVDKRIFLNLELPDNAENAVFNEAGKFVAFTVDDDLFVLLSSGEKVQITTDGGNGIVNGKTVHRSEFGITNGIFDSPEGNFIAFYRMDERQVTDYPLVDFMARVAEHKPVKYPMAGMKSHHVTVGVYNISTGKTIFLDSGGDPEHYLTNLAWSPDEKFIYLAELNRDQNHMQLNCYDAATGSRVRSLFEERHEKYVEPLHPIRFSNVNGQEFYHLSRRDGWLHLYHYNTDGELIRQITGGDWEVTGIPGFDEKGKILFVEATKESPLERHIYRVDIRSGRMEKLTDEAGIHQGLPSPGGDYLIDRFNGPDNPSQTVLLSGKGKRIRTLQQAKDLLEDFELGENRLVAIRSADGKTGLYGRMILPPNFDPGEKYPVIVYVYGGPHAQLVDKSWHNGARWWQYYMASQGYIAFTMDNRGTSNRGMDFELVIHRRLGVLETEDQMQGIEYLKSLPFVDVGRIGVHGWSYGGFMTLNLMLRHPEVFKVGVAGGPVVDWSMYEVMYGERYMDKPQDNPDGYRETNMLNHVSNLKGRLMLIHGAQDDVVVMQQSMQFLSECVKQDKQVDFYVYPTHPHNVRGKDRLHLMEKVSRYFIENL
jgi:dipeptidyl-peptidase 4